jgi:hypothetical protein
MAIIAPLESPSLLDPSPGELERAEVVGDNIMVSVDFNAFSSPEPFSLGHSLKIRLWVRRLKEEI